MNLQNIRLIIQKYETLQKVFFHQYCNYVIPRHTLQDNVTYIQCLRKTWAESAVIQWQMKFDQAVFDGSVLVMNLIRTECSTHLPRTGDSHLMSLNIWVTK